MQLQTSKQDSYLSHPVSSPTTVVASRSRCRGTASLAGSDSKELGAPGSLGDQSQCSLTTEEMHSFFEDKFLVVG